MKRKIFTLMFGALIAVSAFAQRPLADVLQATVSPVIDGVPAEGEWADALVYTINQPFQAETPTVNELGGESNWRALWAPEGMYILVSVADDVWFPSYINGGDSYMSDKVELYFDCNFTLIDGGGANTPGHYQVEPAFALGNVTGLPQTRDDGIVYAFMVNDPDYTAEYFIPWSKLKDLAGVGLDKTAPMGFDVTIVDRDALDADGGNRSRAVWANVGLVNQSWANMDDMGYVTFVGAEPGTWIESIDITNSLLDITVDNGTLQMETDILPVDATDKTLGWTVENVSGKATISSTGLLTAIVDGEVIVSCQALDGSFTAADPVTVTISNQYVWSGELSTIKNGYFKDGLLDWAGNAVPTITVADGILTLPSTLSPPNAETGAIPIWDYALSQALPMLDENVEYILTVRAWADAVRPFSVSIEDAVQNNYRRYGASPNVEADGGRSQWLFDITDVPTTYTFSVTFDEQLDNTTGKIQFALANSDIVTYIDYVTLVRADAVYNAVSVKEAAAAASVTVSPVPAVDVINVAGANANAAVEVYNSVGQKVAVAKADANGAAVVAVSSFAKGLYFVKTSGAVVKFVK